MQAEKRKEEWQARQDNQAKLGMLNLKMVPL
jgi:hypothetical protein